MSDTARPARRQNGALTPLLIFAATVLGSALLAAAPANADPSPFNTLNCTCPTSAPAGSPARHDAIARGLLRGELGWPAQPTSDPGRQAG
ncbi:MULTISPECIES: hypothetical protein [unclassified Mycobacterium]|uniref:hypothetical protein n=1 Tax=unclassified Mycobacterium TaxID=2642494 RepID=UPI0007FD5883|nr:MULTISPECIES: hypothetical protein [unclassified Mycobacterium]OBG66208.1 hypothetical protein A5702_18610 [Mycobacterium sp. E3339]OBH85907.1 hypothetical protein A5680_06475 [Mycobacterium sp. E2989]